MFWFYRWFDLSLFSKMLDFLLELLFWDTFQGVIHVLVSLSIETIFVHPLFPDTSIYSTCDHVDMLFWVGIQFPGFDPICHYVFQWCQCRAPLIKSGEYKLLGNLNSEDCWIINRQFEPAPDFPNWYVFGFELVYHGLYNWEVQIRQFVCPVGSQWGCCSLNNWNSCVDSMFGVSYRLGLILLTLLGLISGVMSLWMTLM